MWPSGRQETGAIWCLYDKRATVHLWRQKEVKAGLEVRYSVRLDVAFMMYTFLFTSKSCGLSKPCHVVIVTGLTETICA